VVDAKYDILAWNELATYFIGDLSDHPDSDRNVIRWTFAPAAGRRGCQSVPPHSCEHGDREHASFPLLRVIDGHDRASVSDIPHGGPL
jgi:hypothetical protein